MPPKTEIANFDLKNPDAVEFFKKMASIKNKMTGKNAVSSALV